jgi:two-component system NtrC family sensor kinase
MGTSSAQWQIVHVLKDITDRREAERRYRELFDNIQEGIFFSTPQGRFVEVNDALVRMLGYRSREEVIQLDIPTEVYFSPRRREELAELFARQGGLHNQEEVLRRKDGSPVHVYINCFGVRDAAGNILQYRGVMLDITGLRQSQTELQKERDFSSKILSHTQSLILVTDTEGVISYANRRWSGLGFQQNQVLTHPLPELCAAQRRAALREALAEVARGQQVDNFDLPLIRGDGVSGQFSANLSPISGEDGRVSSIVVVMTDVTDSAMLRSKLIHAEKMAAVGHLVSGVAHEVNNPLTAILGFTDLLMENPEIPESARRDLRVILQEAQRTKQIVQNLLSFARQMPPQRKLIQLNSILQRTVHLRSYDFISHGIQVIEHLDESLPQVVGDSHQLQQVFLNILNNAYDAVRETARPARIEIMSALAGPFVEISFRDNGTGIADPEHIFDPFVTTKDVGQGTGLGLSICYGIVREHCGEILGHNNLDSEGATFIVRLPVTSETASFGAAAGVHPK